MAFAKMSISKTWQTVYIDTSKIERVYEVSSRVAEIIFDSGKIIAVTGSITEVIEALEEGDGV